MDVYICTGLDMETQYKEWVYITRETFQHLMPPGSNQAITMNNDPTEEVNNQTWPSTSTTRCD
jgi:hypothetical protein